MKMPCSRPSARRLLVALLVAALTVPAVHAQLGAGGSLEGDGVGAGGAVDAAEAAQRVGGAVERVEDAADAGRVEASAEAGLEGASLRAEVAATAPRRADLEARARAWDALDDTERARVEARAAETGLHGHFGADGAHRSGRHASVTLDAAGTALTGHSVSTADGEVRFLERVELLVDARAEPFDAGSSVALWAGGARLEAQDTRDGTLFAQAGNEPVDVQVDLVPNSSARLHGDWLLVTSAGREGALTISGGGTFDRSAAQAGGSVRVHLEPWAQLRFEARDDAQDADEFREEQRARQESRVGAAVRIADLGTRLDATVDELSVQVHARERGADGVVVEVSSDDHRPRIVTVDLDAALFDGGVGLRFNGEPVNRSSAAEVYAGDHAATTFSVVRVDGHYRAVVWVEGFSTNELAFHSERPSGGAGGAGGSEEVGAPGPALPLMVAGALAAAYVMRRRG